MTVRTGLTSLLASPALARAYALTALSTAFGNVLIERLSDGVVLWTIATGLVVIGLGILIVRREEFSLVQLVPLTLLAFAVWALASVTWAQYPAGTFRGWLSFAAFAFMGLVVAQTRDTLQTVRAIGDVLRVVLSVSLLVEIFSGILIDMPLKFLGVQGAIAEGGPIQGIFANRHLLGLVAVIAIITFVIEGRTQSVRPGVAIFSLALGGLCAVFSAAPMVWILAAVMGVVTGALAVVRHSSPQTRRRVQWSFAGVGVTALLVAYLARRPLIAWLGAGPELSERVTLWKAVFEIAKYSPVQGWGWTGAWNPTEFPYIMININVGDTNPSALNAYADVLLQLGWVGLLLFAAMAGAALVRSWLVASERRSVLYAWTPLVLIALLVDSAFESYTLSTMGLMLLVVCVSRAGQGMPWRRGARHAARG